MQFRHVRCMLGNTYSVASLNSIKFSLAALPLLLSGNAPLSHLLSKSHAHVVQALNLEWQVAIYQPCSSLSPLLCASVDRQGEGELFVDLEQTNSMLSVPASAADREARAFVLQVRQERRLLGSRRVEGK